MEADEMYELMGKQLSGNATATEEDLLRAHINNDPEAARTYQQLQQIWDKSPDTFVLPDIDSAWEKVNRATTKRMPPLYQQTWWRIAALVILIGFAGILWFMMGEGKTSRIQTASGEYRKIELQDGSVIWMKPSSTITYFHGLHNGKREIALNGTAFFQVARDTLHPFVISTGSGSVTVLGTSFEVHAHAQDSFERVTVATGKVRFARTEGPEMILTAGQEGVIMASGQTQQTTVGADDLTSWKDGRLLFANESMEQVLVKLERYFDIRFTVTNPRILSCRFTGTFDKPRVDEVLRVLSKALNLNVKKEQQSYVISGEGCKP